MRLAANSPTICAEIDVPRTTAAIALMCGHMGATLQSRSDIGNYPGVDIKRSWLLSYVWCFL